MPLKKLFMVKPHLRAGTQPRAHAAHRPNSAPLRPTREDETARLTSPRSVGPTCYVRHFLVTIQICVRKIVARSGIDPGSTSKILLADLRLECTSAEH